MTSYHPNTGNCPCQCECHCGYGISIQNDARFTSQLDTVVTINKGLHNYITAPYGNNPKRHAGILRINIIVCLDRVSSIIPKIGSSHYDDLNFRGMIKRNIEIPTRSSSAEIYEFIHNLFSNHLNGKRWCLFNSSSCTLRKVSYNEITCDLIKQNLTKQKKMYIAPDVIDIPETFYVPDVIEITNAFDVPDITDACDFPDVTNTFDFPDASNVTDAFDVPDAIDVLDTSGVTDAFDVLDAFNVPDAFFPNAFFPHVFNVTDAFAFNVPDAK
ncbi:unnamed protein product [Rhizophagus irregularis]|uniref:Uncharacterized protein n=1 Tax=Rhizophagus irregularis TaxID=588596 RepID=A0A2N1NKW7_9GLOM|nr:hypothetical protein RhiirC2_820669 [Rhizophagus irregularis]CAB4385006.1 unnamed protein product [Rhizophagus irregularis]CAB5312257.1 unnamed protein product [Rhizophagus irregularis]